MKRNFIKICACSDWWFEGKLQAVTLTFCLRVPIAVWAAVLLNPLPALVPGMAVEDGPRAGAVQLLWRPGWSFS